MIKKESSQQSRKRENFINLIKIIYKNPIANILNSAKTQCFPCKTGNKRRMTALLYSTGEVLARTVRQDKEMKDTYQKERTIPICR